MEKKEILQIKDVCKTYRSRNGIETKALDQITLSIEENEMVAIMGNSGSGKTTLIHILTGLLDPDSGEIILDDSDILQLSRDAKSGFRRKHVGIVFQNYNLIDSLTVEENIKVPLILDEQYYDQDEKVSEVASLLGIYEQLKKYPYEISGGQQQRTGICRAIVNEPKIIFADEPTGNLDSRSTEQVMEYFVKACREKEASLLMVTHDAKAASYCDRVVFLCDGNIVAEQRKGRNNREVFHESILELQKGDLYG